MGIVEDLLSNSAESKCLINLQKLREISGGKGVVIWGTGRSGMYALNVCRKEKIDVVCFVDGLQHKQGETMENLSVYYAKDFLMEINGSWGAVIVACMPEYGAAEWLSAAEIPYVDFDVTMLFEGIELGSFSEIMNQNSSQIEQVYDYLEDDVSRRSYKGVLKYRLTLERGSLLDIYDPDIYFGNGVVKGFSGGTFVDCGASCGDTLKQFMLLENLKYETYLALEPSKIEFAKLLNTLKTEEFKNVIPLNIGVWNERTDLCFDLAGGSNGRIDDGGNAKISVDALDNICQDYQVDLIKMDVEGAEIPALKGAEQCIKRCRPILAVSIYHHASDLWQIPLQIKQIDPSYKLYVRHHSMWLEDTVCYAVPC